MEAVPFQYATVGLLRSTNSVRSPNPFKARGTAASAMESGMTNQNEAAREGEVTVRGLASGFAQTVQTRSHRLVADEPLAFGGTGTGPTPYDLLLAALGA
jgi:hypothetical protein